jgi:hypothetical protein
MLMLLLVFLLLAAPAVASLIIIHGPLSLGRGLFFRRLRAGAPIVYRVSETSTCPSADARDVYPAEHGDSYYYTTNKYWRVEEVRQDGSIVARTTSMEQRHLRPDDPNLRKASLIERLRYGTRFPHPA